MSKSNNNKNVRGKKQVNLFLNEVRENLPEWLKEKKEDIEVLEELESHIWDKADAIADQQNTQITEEIVSEAIDSMGTPKAIAQAYKKRGTPKYYITEELWPYYTKTLGIVSVILFALNFLGAIFRIGEGGLQIWFDLIFGAWSAIIMGAVVVTGIFVALSMEGYLPEDLKEIIDYEEEVSKWKDERAKKQKKAKKVDPPFSRGDVIADGIFTIILGVLLLVQPFESINLFLGETMLEWLRLVSIFTLGEGVMSLNRSFRRMEQIRWHQGLIAAKTFIGVAAVLILIWDLPAALLSIEWLAGHSESIAVFGITVRTIIEYVPQIGLFFMGIDIIETIVRIVRLPRKYEKYMTQKATN